MVSIDTVKKLLRISTSDAAQDIFISLMLPIVYSDIVSECNNLFPAPGFDISSSEIYFDSGTTNQIKLDSGGFGDIGFVTGADIVVSGSRANDGIYTITAQSDTALTVSQILYDEAQTSTGYSVKVSMCRFPEQLALVAAKMIGYQLNNVNNAGVTSQSIGDYSESRESITTGYPSEILAMLGLGKTYMLAVARCSGTSMRTADTSLKILTYMGMVYNGYR